MKKQNLFIRAWKGEAELWEAWWLVGLAAILTIRLILMPLNTLVAASGEEGFNYIIIALTWGIQVFWWRVAWICSANPTKTVWTFLAKLLIFLAAFSSFGEFMSSCDKQKQANSYVNYRKPEVQRSLSKTEPGKTVNDGLEIAFEDWSRAHPVVTEKFIAAGEQGDYVTVNRLIAEHPPLLDLQVNSLLAEHPQLRPHEAFLKRFSLANARNNQDDLARLQKEYPESFAAVMQALFGETDELVHAKRADGWTALHAQSWAGNKSVVTMLLSQGADVEAKSNDGWTALHAASVQGHADIAILLLEMGASPNVSASMAGTPLQMAVAHGHESVVKVLLANGADPNDKNNDNWSILHASSYNGNKVMVRLLLEYGAEINAKDNFGRSPIQAAQIQGHKEIIKMLVEKDRKTLLDLTSDNVPLDSKYLTTLKAELSNNFSEIEKDRALTLILKIASLLPGVCSVMQN